MNDSIIKTYTLYELKIVYPKTKENGYEDDSIVEIHTLDLIKNGFDNQEEVYQFMQENKNVLKFHDYVVLPVLSINTNNS